MQIFLIVSTCFLYLIAAGLFSKGVWYLESNAVSLSYLKRRSEAERGQWNKIIGGDAAETGSGPGSYDIRKSVWHVNVSLLQSFSLMCLLCLFEQRANPYINGGGGWGIFNAILGWQNSATLGSVISYNLYWLTVIVGFLAMGYNEKKGSWPAMKNMQSTARGNKFLASIRPKVGSTTRSSSNDDSLEEKKIESSKNESSQEKVTTEVRRVSS